VIQCGADDAIVEINAAGVNPSDVKAATGLMPYAVFPRTPGRDFAGTVVDGPSQWLGKEVFGTSGDLGIRRDGTHATHLVVEAAALVEKPANMSMEEAAGIGVPFVTAIEGFRRTGEPTAAETVLIMGVNGKVGQAAAQLAILRGARVIGVARGDRRRSLFPGRAQVAGAGRAADPDRGDRPYRAVRYPRILSRPSHLCRYRHARAVVGGQRRNAARGFGRIYQRQIASVPDCARRNLWTVRCGSRLCHRAWRHARSRADQARRLIS